MSVPLLPALRFVQPSASRLCIQGSGERSENQSRSPGRWSALWKEPAIAQILEVIWSAVDNPLGRVFQHGEFAQSVRRGQNRDTVFILVVELSTDSRNDFFDAVAAEF